MMRWLNSGAVILVQMWPHLEHGAPLLGDDSELRQEGWKLALISIIDQLDVVRQVHKEYVGKEVGGVELPTSAKYLQGFNSILGLGSFAFTLSWLPPEKSGKRVPQETKSGDFNICVAYLTARGE